MRGFRDFKERKAYEFIERCEEAGFKFFMRDDELGVISTFASCRNIRMRWFSENLDYLEDEITEIICRRETEHPHLKIFSLYGKRI